MKFNKWITIGMLFVIGAPLLHGQIEKTSFRELLLKNQIDVFLPVEAKSDVKIIKNKDLKMQYKLQSSALRNRDVYYCVPETIQQVAAPHSALLMSQSLVNNEEESYLELNEISRLNTDILHADEAYVVDFSPKDYLSEFESCQMLYLAKKDFHDAVTVICGNDLQPQEVVKISLSYVSKVGGF